MFNRNHTLKIMLGVLLTFFTGTSTSWGAFGHTSNWPKSIDPIYGYFHEPIYADLNGDQKQEILVVNTELGSSGFRDKLYVYNIDGSPFIPGSEGFFAEVDETDIHDVIVSDLDNSGVHKIVLTSSEGIYVFRTDTSLERKWKFSETIGAGWRLYGPSPAYPVSGPTTVRDLDNDGKMEILVPVINQTNMTKLPLMVYTHLGTAKPGFPIANPFKKTTFDGKIMAIAEDMNGDGYKEIVLMAPQRNTTLAYVNAITCVNHLGQIKWHKNTWPKGVASLLATDVDGDGQYEAIVTGVPEEANDPHSNDPAYLSRITILMGDGSILGGEGNEAYTTLALKPFEGEESWVGFLGDPVAADINGDLIPEIIYSNEYSEYTPQEGTTGYSMIHAFSLTERRDLNGYPKTIPDINTMNPGMPDYNIKFDKAYVNVVANADSLNDGMNDIYVYREKFIPSNQQLKPMTMIYAFSQFGLKSGWPLIINSNTPASQLSCNANRKFKMAVGKLDNNFNADPYIVQATCGDSLYLLKDTFEQMDGFAAGWRMVNFDAEQSRCVTPGVPACPINHLPYFEKVDNQNIKTPTMIQFVVSAFDIDNDPVTLGVQNYLPNNANFYPATGTFTWNVTQDQIKTMLGKGGYDIIFTANDGFGTSKMKVNIRNKNKKPSFKGLKTQKVQAGQPVVVILEGKDKDADPLTFSVDEMMKPASASLNGSVFTWPDPPVGKHSIPLTVSDGVNSKTKFLKIKVSY